MPVTKATLIFSFTPSPSTPGAVTPGRDGGWSENFWYPTLPTVANMAALARARAGMLAGDCFISGWRAQLYSIQGNALTPVSSVAGLFYIPPGRSGTTPNPDTALQLRAQAAGQSVTWTQYLHAMPNGMVTSNQYTPDIPFITALQTWGTALIGQGAVPMAIQWVGRDKLQLPQRVLAINPALGTITTAQPLGGVVAPTSWIRLHRVTGDLGLPIKGTFNVLLVTANPNGSVTYTVSGLPNLVLSHPSGTARADLIAVSPLTNISLGRIIDRKIGRPSGLFRGRRTKQRA
jgi:hypothetical protein